MWRGVRQPRVEGRGSGGVGGVGLRVVEVLHDLPAGDGGDERTQLMLVVKSAISAS